MSKVGTSVKVDEAQLGVLKKAAHLAHEDYTEFMVNSAMLRIELKLLGRKPQSPMKAYEQLHLRPYAPGQVSPAVAKEIAELVAKDDRGELEFEELGKIKVRPPFGAAMRQAAVKAPSAKLKATNSRRDGA